MVFLLARVPPRVTTLRSRRSSRSREAVRAANTTESSAPATGNSASKARLANIEHWIVIYQENWSFDGLYGKFPGADGLNHAAATGRPGRPQRAARWPPCPIPPPIPAFRPDCPSALTTFRST